MNIVNKNTDRESGAKNSPIKYFTDTRPTDKKGNPLPFAVAMVAKCVAHYRKMLRPLKTIWLCPKYYNEFDYWSRSHMMESEADAKIKLWTLDGVEIELMGRHHILKQKDGDIASIDWDYYPKVLND